MSAGAAVLVAGYLGINPPGFVAEVVAFAFGLAAASFFPAFIMGIFSKRMNREGAVLGMISGISLTAAYIVYFKFVNPAANTAEHWWFGISPEGIGTVGMLVNFAVAWTVSRFTPPLRPESRIWSTSSACPEAPERRTRSAPCQNLRATKIPGPASCMIAASARGS